MEISIRHLHHQSSLKRGKALRYPGAWLYSLRNIPYRVGLGLVVLCFLLCTILLAMGFPSPYNGSLFTIPVALAAWMLRGRGAFLCIVSTLLVLGVINISKMDGDQSSQSLVTVLLIGAIALATEGFFIGMLRRALDQTDAALQQAQQAQQAQQKITIAYEQQRQLNQLKDEFLVNINHELRTPLTEVAGYIELLREHHEQLDPQAQAIFLEYAAQGCEELLISVNNVLDAAEVSDDFQPPHPAELAISEVVQTALEQFDPRRLQEHPLQVEVPEQLTAWADARYTCQILRNLLSNAFKYSPTDTPVVIGAALREISTQDAQTTPQVCISVQDAGPGIPPAESPLLFQKFVRLHRDLSGTVRGTGLGLYLSKRFVEAMGGRIWVESTGTAGQGSCFYFTLPITT